MDGLGGERPGFAEGVEEITFDEGTEDENIGGGMTCPAHASELGALSDDVTTGAFDGAGANKVALLLERPIGHAMGVVDEILELIVDAVPDIQRE